MKLRLRSAPRVPAFIALAMLLLAMQWFAQVHRILHAPLATTPATELWLQVANGADVTALTWAHDRANTHALGPSVDPWSHHQSSMDCASFDAMCAGDLPLLALAATPALTPALAIFERAAVADVAARLPRPRARAPPAA